MKFYVNGNYCFIMIFLSMLNLCYCIEAVLRENLEKYLKNQFSVYKRRGLEFSHILEMNFSFVTNLNHMTYEHYIEQPMPIVERLINKKLYKNYDLIKSLDGIDWIIHMGNHETGKADIHYNSRR